MKLLKNIPKLPLLLILIVTLGGILRFYNLNWDNYLIFHPDERNIDASVARISFFSQLNPGFFAYGGLPIYLYRVAGDILNLIEKTQIWTYDWGHINVIGRTFSAFFSTSTIIFIYLTGRKLLGKKTAILAAAIFAFTVSSIQISHFATTESFLVLIVSILLYLSVLVKDKQTIVLFVALGFFLGLGTAAKTTAVSFLLIPGTVFLLLVKFNIKKILIVFLKVMLFLLVALATFTIFSPYTFLSSGKFLESMNYESGVVTGRLAVPYTHQFDKAIPYAFELINMFWQMGPIFIFSVLGFFIVLYKIFKKRHLELFFLLLFPLAYFLYIGMWHTKFIRYMTPLLPFFALYASIALSTIYKKNKIIGKVLIAISVIITFLWAVSYISIYMRPQTRYSASVWMYQHIKQDDKVYTEHWDDGLPITIEGVKKSISTEQLTIYDNEFNEKAQYYADKLSTGNYVILVTRRLYGTLIFLPKEYPTTSTYYKKLFNGQLGYKKVAEFSSYPNLFGISINDDASEESFQVYDHPKILIFKNISHFTKQRLMKALSI